MQKGLCLNKPKDEQTGAEVRDDELVGVQQIAEITGLAVIWLDKEMAWFAGSSGKRGRSATYSDAPMQF